MKSFKEVLNESKKITIYHGDNHKTTKLSPKMMMQTLSNNQEGIGIYFGTLEVAKEYGKNIISVEVDSKSFFNSRDLIKDVRYLKTNLYKLLSELHKLDNEPLYYSATDWGIEVHKPKDMTQQHLKELSLNLVAEEVRNFQISMAQDFGVEKFVKIWNKILPKNNGTYNNDIGGIWAIINPKLKVTEVK